MGFHPLTYNGFLVFCPSYGAIAQLGERMTGSHEVRSSILLGSTREDKGRREIAGPFSMRAASFLWKSPPRGFHFSENL